MAVHVQTTNFSIDSDKSNSEVIINEEVKSLEYLSFIKIFRIFRVFRLAKILRRVKAMRKILNGVNKSIVNIGFAVMLLFIFIILCIVRWQRLERCQLISSQLYSKNDSDNGEIELSDNNPDINTDNYV